MPFTESDWRYLQTQMAWIEDRLRAKRAHVIPCKFDPPIPMSQVEAFRRETGLDLPEDFVTLTTQYCGGWSHWWSLCQKQENGRDKWLEPSHYLGKFGGGDEPFIGASQERTLVNIYNQFQREIRRTWIANSPEGLATIENLKSIFPLQFALGGGADYAVLRLDTSPAQVEILDHELSYKTTLPDTIVGHGLGNFLRDWAYVGFVSANYMSLINKPVQAADPKEQVAATAADWVRWLNSDEAATEHTCPTCGLAWAESYCRQCGHAIDTVTDPAALPSSPSSAPPPGLPSVLKRLWGLFKPRR